MLEYESLKHTSINHQKLDNSLLLRNLASPDNRKHVRIYKNMLVIHNCMAKVNCMCIIYYRTHPKLQVMQVHHHNSVSLSSLKIILCVCLFLFWWKVNFIATYQVGAKYVHREMIYDIEYTIRYQHLK